MQEIKKVNAKNSVSTNLNPSENMQLRKVDNSLEAVISRIALKNPLILIRLSPEEQEKEDQERNAEALRELRKNLHYFHVPPEFEKASLDNYSVDTFEKKRALSAAQQFFQEFTENQGLCASMIFYGKIGNGKTHLAYGIMKALAKKYICKYTTAVGASDEVRECINNKFKQESEVIKKYTECDLLVIDEIGRGRQRDTDHEKNVMFSIINGRYLEKKPTIVISNEGIEGIKHYITEAAFDRLLSRDGTVIAFNWESERSKQYV